MKQKNQLLLKYITGTKISTYRFDKIKLSENFEIKDKISKGFKIKTKFASAVILEKINKDGIYSILAGPISASIGFSD